MSSAQELYLKAFVGGFAQVGGVATLLVRAASTFMKTTGAALVAPLMANPSAVHLGQSHFLRQFY